MLVLGFAAGCGPKESASPGAAASAPVPVDPAVNLQRLAHPLVAPPLKWDIAENVVVSEAPESAKSGGKAVLVTPTADMGLHRVGLVGNFSHSKATYHVTVWVKATPGTDLLLEARGDTMLSDREPAEYKRAFFDLTANTLQPNELMTEKTNFASPGISQDGDWKKISVDMSTSDGWIYVVLGLTAKGKHGFAGTPDMGLTVGGVEVTPAD
jgi:hypothetical protein